MSQTQNVVWLAQGMRLREFYLEVGLTQVDLGKILGVRQTNISNTVKGHRGIPWKWALILKQKYTNLNINWLMTGDGEMFEEFPVDSSRANDEKHPYLMPLQSAEVAAMLARVQKEQADTRAWRAEIEQRLEDVARRLKGIQEGL